MDVKPIGKGSVECFFNAFFAQQETEKPAPGSGGIIRIPAGQSANFNRLLQVALAIKKADQAGGKVNAGGKAAVAIPFLGGHCIAIGLFYLVSLVHVVPGLFPGYVCEIPAFYEIVHPGGI